MVINRIPVVKNLEIKLGNLPLGYSEIKNVYQGNRHLFKALQFQWAVPHHKKLLVTRKSVICGPIDFMKRKK